MHEIIIVKFSEINDIFSDYKAIYISEEKEVSQAGVYGNNEVGRCSKLQEIHISTEVIKKELNIGQPYKVEGILSFYAKNPDKGVLLTITKLL